jgi:uncharacterized protein (UPF0548 family)
MSVSVLPPAEVAELAARPLTYSPAGATRGSMPADYHQVSQALTLPGVDFVVASRLLMSWQVPSRAGFDVRVSAPGVEPDAVVLMRVGLGPVGLSIPCRIVYVIDEPQRQGYAYGTLPGHPESGEESFVLTVDADGTTTFTITAFSKPATLMTRLGGPFGHTVQRAVTRRYLRTLRTA